MTVMPPVHPSWVLAESKYSLLFGIWGYVGDLSYDPNEKSGWDMNSDDTLQALKITGFTLCAMRSEIYSRLV